MTVFTRAWWDAAGTRAANTAIAAIIPLAALLVSGQVSPLYMLSMTALTSVGSLLTSTAGLPEVSGRTTPLFQAIVVRSLKTLGQVGIPALGTVLLIQDVDWRTFGVLTGGATLATILRTLKDYLPETELPADSGVLITSPGVTNISTVNVMGAGAATTATETEASTPTGV